MMFSSTGNLRTFVDRLARHSLLGEAEKDCLLSLPVRQRQIDTNRDLVRQGENVEYACLVTSGFLARCDQAPEGKRQVVALHIPGDMVDLHAAVRPMFTTGLQTLCPTTVLQVRHSDLRAAAADHPCIAEAFWRECSAEMSIMAQWVVNVGRRCASARLAHFLCETAWRLGAVNEGASASFHFPLTQSHLAEITGMTTVHINRTLGVLRGVGTTVRKKRVTITHWPTLVAAGDFDARYLELVSRPDESARIAA